MGLPKTAPGPKYDPIQLQKEIQRLQTEDRGIEGEKILRKNTWKLSKQLKKNPSENMNENLNAWLWFF